MLSIKKTSDPVFFKNKLVKDKHVLEDKIILEAKEIQKKRLQSLNYQKVQIYRIYYPY
jgi:hypothetical protein